MTWSKDELRRIAEADDLHIAPFREDGVTYGTPTWIWSVAVDDALYVRGYNGPNSRWYQAAVRQKAGRIIAAGMIKDVMFEPVSNDALNDAKRHLTQAQPAPTRVGQAIVRLQEVMDDLGQVVKQAVRPGSATPRTLA